MTTNITNHQNAITIRRVEPSDVSTIVNIHLAAFPGFFLTFLGPAFLREFYQAIASDPSGIAYVGEQSGRVVGFVVGTDQPAGFYRRLLRRRGWRFGLASVGAVLRRPAVVPRLLRAFSMPHQAASLAEAGTLMSIAVLPVCQGSGVGQALVKAFLQEAARRNLNQVNLTTDRINNEATNGFYQRLGFICVRSFITPEGRAMNEYVIELAVNGALSPAARISQK